MPEPLYCAVRFFPHDFPIQVAITPIDQHPCTRCGVGDNASMLGTLQLHADPVFPCSYQDGWWMLIKRLPNHLVFVNPTCNARRQKFERKHVNIAKSSDPYRSILWHSDLFIESTIATTWFLHHSPKGPKSDLSSIRRHLPCSFPPMKPVSILQCPIQMKPWNQVLRKQTSQPATTVFTGSCPSLMDSATECMVSTVTIWLLSLPSSKNGESLRCLWLAPQKKLRSFAVGVESGNNMKY